MAETFFVVRSWSDRHPGRYYLYDDAEDALTFLGDVAGWIEPTTMVAREPVAIPARDTQIIRGYITRPADGVGSARPLLVWLNDDPLGHRWSWGFDRFAQYMAARGVTLLQVDLRGAAGYGRAYQSGGWREQLGVTQTDLADVVRWAVETGEADADGICVGGRIGGAHAALIALTRSRPTFQCGALVAPPSDMVYHLRGSPDSRRHQFARAFWDQRMGNPVRDRETLRAMSPLNDIDKLQAPIIVIQGWRTGYRISEDDNWFSTLMGKRDEVRFRSHYNRLVGQLELEGKEHSSLLVRFEDDFLPTPGNQVIYFERLGDFVTGHIGGIQGASRHSSRASDSSASVSSHEDAAVATD